MYLSVYVFNCWYKVPSFLFLFLYIAWSLENVEKGISFLNLYFDLNFLHLFKGALKNMFNFQNFLF